MKKKKALERNPHGDLSRLLQKQVSKRNPEENLAGSTSSLKKRYSFTGSDVVTYRKEMRSQKERKAELKRK